MYDFDDHWSTQLLLLTGEFSPLGCFALAFIAGAATTLVGVGLWNWLVK